MAKPKHCFKTQHKAGCRPGRPLCRWRRKEVERHKVCWCERYHFPHRKGSGRCGSDEQFWDFLYGPSWREEAGRQDTETNEAGPVAFTEPGSEVPF